MIDIMLRHLNLNEIEEKLSKYSNDILHADYKLITEKITHLFYFLNSQPITKNILDNIEEDFLPIKESLPPVEYNHLDGETINKTSSIILSHEMKGALGYFLIQRLYDLEKKDGTQYIELAFLWGKVSSGNFNEWNEVFKDVFFIPLIDLIQWYIYEHKTDKPQDYLSRSEIDILNSKLDKLSKDLSEASLKHDFGQEIIFAEIEELKELLIVLNKKNWKQLVKGKLGDLVTDSILNPETASKAYNFLSESGILPSLNG